MFIQFYIFIEFDSTEYACHYSSWDILYCGYYLSENYYLPKQNHTCIINQCRARCIKHVHICHPRTLRHHYMGNHLVVIKISTWAQEWVTASWHAIWNSVKGRESLKRILEATLVGSSQIHRMPLECMFMFWFLGDLCSHLGTGYVWKLSFFPLIA